MSTPNPPDKEIIRYVSQTYIQSFLDNEKITYLLKLYNTIFDEYLKYRDYLIETEQDLESSIILRLISKELVLIDEKLTYDIIKKLRTETNEQQINPTITSSRDRGIE